MSRFDDEIRSASQQLAREAMPEALLDESLEPIRRQPRAAWLTGAAVAAVALVLVVGWLAGRSGLRLATDESPSPSAIVATCADLPAINARSTEYRVYFPCAHGNGLGSGTRVGPAMTGSLLLESAVRDLLNGPNGNELDAGVTAVAPPNSGALLVSVSLQADGLAIVDLADEAAAAGLQPSFVDAMRATALDQAAVTAVQLRMSGDCEDLFALFGAACDDLAEPIALATDCPVVTPGGLPQGDIVMGGTFTGRPHPAEANTVSWGAGDDTVTERVGEPGGELFPIDGQTMPLPSLDGVTAADGSAFTWVASGCPYLVTMHGRGEAFAQDYSNLFFTEPASQPIATPQPDAPYGTASVEKDGIRITLTLDRIETTFGRRVWADVTVENVGSDVVHWGHSGTCDWPAGVTLTTDAALPSNGREWPGEAGVLKSVTVDDIDAWRFGFVPEWAVDREGSWGCTSDLVPDEIRPGERRSARFAWDTDGMNGMAPPGGLYIAQSVFGYQGRGDIDPNADPLRKQVAVQVLLDVRGLEREYIPPGEAVDLLLEDAAFTQLLAENPRTQWTSSTLRWDNETWHLEIAQRAPHGSVVATVDAITGEVSDVEVLPR
jgi:hypothetical protein